MVQLDQVIQVWGGGTEVEEAAEESAAGWHNLGRKAEGPYQGEEVSFGAGRPLQLCGQG